VTGAVEQNDPTELLEVFDARGQPTGRSKSRGAVHLDGDWHQAFHCWILRRDGREVVLQRRSLTKDTFAGYWDAAAAGHWRVGESAAEASREIAEELGLDINFAKLTYRGRERASRRFPNGLVDREFHQVYVLVFDAPLSLYRPDAAEVIGLGAFPSRQLVDLAAGKLSHVPATEAISIAGDGRMLSAQVVLEREDLVPYSAARLRRMLGSANSR
jgi:isopentenyldiphosphate isomerase